MRFKDYLQEEYFARNNSFEIFKNPSQTELQKLFRISNRSIRIAIDEADKKTWYAFPSSLLHQYAIETMIREDLVDDTTFRAAEVYIAGDSVNIFIYYGSYVIKNGKAKFKSVDYNKKDFLWLKDKFKFLNMKVVYDEDGIIKEEYFTRSSKWEIFKNPSNREVSYLANTSKKLGGHGSIRFLLTMDKETLYAFAASMLHGNAALVIDEQNGTDIGGDYEENYFALQGEFKEGVISMKTSVLTNLSVELERELEKVFKNKFNIKIEFWERL